MDIDLLSKMVKELILDKDEVSLPGVGTFVAEMVPSVFSDKGYTINPPYKRLSFRQKGTGDDSLLIDFYARCNNLDIETASRIIREFLHEMRHVLETRKSIVFPGLGKLRATRENYFFFVADEDLDIYPEGFGLEPISLKTHEETPAEVSATMAALRGILNPEETAAGEVNVNVAPDSVHDFVTSEANAAVKINIPVREVPVSGSQVGAGVEPGAAPSGIIDKESGVDSFESADKAIDNERSGEGIDSDVQHDEAVSAGEKVSDAVAGDGVGDASVPGTAESPAAGQKADTGSNVVSVECLDTAVDVVDGQVHAAESPSAGQKVEESAVAEDAATSANVGESAETEGAAMAAKVEESAGAVVAEAGAAAASGSDMPAAGQSNADNGSSESASPVAKPASDKSDKVIKTKSGRFSKKKPNWQKVLKWSCIGVVLLSLTMLLAFIALAHIAPDFIDSILYSPDELRIINY